MAHGAGPTSNGNRVSAGRWWHVRSTNTPYVPPRMCVGRVLLSAKTGRGAGRWWRVRSTNTPCVPPWMCGGRVLLSGTRGGADIKREPDLRRALLACPLNQHALRSAADVCGGRVLLSGTRGGADVKRELGLCRALVACPLNQHALRPAADVWGAGITEWHTGRGRHQTGSGSLPRVGGVSAQPTHPTSRRACVGGGYY